MEDHADMRRFIVETLRDEWRVVATSRAVDALAVLQREAPDLIVTDLMMPDVSGEQLVAEVRARPDLAQVPILILSARADDELRLGLLASSVQDYVTKPFSAHELRVRVHNLVTTKKARDALQSELRSRRWAFWAIGCPRCTYTTSLRPCATAGSKVIGRATLG